MSNPETQKAIFHSGELAAQAHAGVHEEIEKLAAKFIRPIFIQQHQEFFNQLPFIVVAAYDENGLPWVTLLAGRPGFITFDDEQHLRIASQPVKGDALQHSLRAGNPLGVIGLAYETKRRNRANGVLVETDQQSLLFKVSQSYGNCPQYIATKNWHFNPPSFAPQVQESSQLTAHMKQWIETSDSFYIGSSNRSYMTSDGVKTHCDMDASHRGGDAGFVKVVSESELVIPDYSGNNFFNTIGNIILNPKVGLLFIDFETGDLLQITAHAKIEWESVEPSQHPLAQRLIKFQIDKIVSLKFS